MSTSTSIAKALSISVPNPMVSTKISVKNHAATELARSVEKAKIYAERMLAKANDPNAKFFDHKVACQSCFGSCFRTVYKNGKRFAKRCESVRWDEVNKKLVCEGNSSWQELELENKKDLANQIWKIVVSLRQKEYFLFWLQKNYQTQSLSSLMIQQLELILRKVQNHSIFANSEASNSEVKQEIATSQTSQIQAA